MEVRNCLILTQYRESELYNDFIGKFYHFPANKDKNYLNQFSSLPIEFVYYEPENKGKGEGVFYGYGKIISSPFPDKREEGHCFVEISEYKPFSKPVYFKNDAGVILEKIHNKNCYNSFNSVRKIDQKFLDDICLDGGILLNIESDAHLIKVLGEQLIGSEKVGILELIKNSIDACASYCRVRIENVPELDKIDSNYYEYPNLTGPVIIVEDDGIGMSQDIIKNGWLRPASTIKTNIKEQLKRERENALISGSLAAYDALFKKLKKEHGRIPLGEKGVGRFATHRLGRLLELRTKTKDIDYELVLKIDWSKFDGIQSDFINLNSIGIALTREKISRDYGIRDSGTKLIIYGGKEGFHWDKPTIQDLNNSVLNLNSPDFKHKFDKNSSDFESFNAYLECPQIEDLQSDQVFSESIPNFTLDAIIDEFGYVDYDLRFKHPSDKVPSCEWNGKKFDLRLPEGDKGDYGYWYIDDEKRNPECGGFYIHLDVWYRKKEWIDLSNYTELIDYLDNYGGISIYRDRVLVLEAKLGSMYDWLELSKAHIKQGFRLSYRDLLGKIETEQKSNFNIIDKTSREGFIENQSYKDLAKLTETLINKILLPKYIEKRDDYSKLVKGIITDPKKLNDVARTGSLFFSNVGESDYPMDIDPYKFFQNLWDVAEERKGGLVNLSESMKQLQKSISMIEEVQDMFVEQAGFGISVAMSLHEINKITSNFYHGISDLLKSGDFNKVRLEDLKVTSQSLRSELKRLGPLRSIRNEEEIEFSIIRSLNFAYEVNKRKLNQDKIDFDILNPEEDFQICGRYSIINQVIGNLIDNSVYWIKYANRERKKIQVLLNNKYRTVIIGDSGSDINEIIRPNLFQPGYSLRIPPSGLGLFICKTYLNSLKGRIYETPVKDRILNLEGAQFTIDFSKTKEK